MKKYISYKLIGLALLIIVGITACETASQDTSPIISPDGYPTVVYTLSSPSTSVKEGDTLVYTISMDKPIDRSITFTPEVTGGTATEDDYTFAPVVMQPYTTEVKFYLIAVADNNPAESTETLQLKFGDFSLADRYLMNLKTVHPTLDISIVNSNDPTLLTVLFSWPDESLDFDLVTFHVLGDGTLEPWGDGGATENNPETDMSINLSDPVGIYYVNIIPWDEDPFPYTFTLGFPDGTVQTIEGTFDYDALSMDPWTYWDANSYDTYRVLKIENTGTGFVVTAL